MIRVSYFILPSHMTARTLWEKVWEHHFNLCHFWWIKVVCLSLFNIAVFSFVRSCPFSSLYCFCSFARKFLRKRTISFLFRFIAEASRVSELILFFLGVEKSWAFPNCFRCSDESKQYLLLSSVSDVSTITSSRTRGALFVVLAMKSVEHPLERVFFLFFWRIHVLLKCRLPPLNWECQDKITFAFLRSHEGTSRWYFCLPSFLSLNLEYWLGAITRIRKPPVIQRRRCKTAESLQ